MSGTKVMCAFCAQDVQTSRVDPCTVVVTNRWCAPEEDQLAQQFFVHADCLRQRMLPRVLPHAAVLDADWDGDRDSDQEGG